MVRVVSGDIWTARPSDGHVRIILDGSETPAIDLPFNDYFSLTESPFDYPALAYKTKAAGHNFYIPIPYQKSCQVLGKFSENFEEKWGLFYHINYATYPEGTTVPTFTRDLSRKNWRLWPGPTISR